LRGDRDGLAVEPGDATHGLRLCNSRGYVHLLAEPA
jgi:hypothetical protein